MANLQHCKLNDAGLTPYRNASLNATAAAIKASGGQVYGFHIDNTANASKTYVHFYNKLVGNVTVGTTTPDVTLVVPASGGVDYPIGQFGIGFDVGITIAATTTVGGNTNPGTAILVNVFYN